MGNILGQIDIIELQLCAHSLLDISHNQPAQHRSFLFSSGHSIGVFIPLSKNSNQNSIGNVRKRRSSSVATIFSGNYDSHARYTEEVL